MAGFDSLSLRPELLVGVARMGFTKLTDIQQGTLPVALSGADVVGHARTGSGKTAAFGLSLLQGLDLSLRSPQALVLCPTRELAQQLTGSLRALAVGLEGTRILTLTGGASSREQREALRAGAHVLVATPGRLLQHLELGRVQLGQLRCLVLDEADRLLDMGFEQEVLSIVDFAPRDRQTLLFSATWPEGMDALCGRVQRDPVVVGVQALLQLEVLRQRVVFCERTQRREALVALLARRDPTSTVVFCETRAQCHEVVRALQSAGAAALALTGELAQEERDDALVQLRNESVRVLVATNVAARGLDLEALGLVVCFELSPDPGVYVHRVGRTARAEAQGEAVSLVAGEKERGRLRAVEEHLGASIPEEPWVTEATSLSAWTAPYRTVVVLGGRKQRLRAGDVLGALTRGVGLQGTDIGKIVLTDRRIWVAVRAEVAQEAAAGLSRARIKKKRFRALLV